MLKKGTASCGCMYKENMYISSNVRNELICINKINRTGMGITKFKNEKSDLKYIHSSCYEFHGKLFFFPDKGHCIHIYNCVTNEQKTIDISGIYTSSNRMIKEIAVYEENIYLFDWNSMLYYCFDLNKEMLRKCDNMMKFGKKSGIHQKEMMFTRIAQKNAKVFLGIRGTNQVIEWDLKNSLGKLHKLSIDNIFGVENTTDGLIISINGSYNLYFWDMNTNISCIFECNRQIKKRGYCRIINYKEYTLAIPDLWNVFLIFKNNILKDVIEYSNVNLKTSNHIFGDLWLVDEDLLIINDRFTTDIVYLNCKDGVLGNNNYLVYDNLIGSRQNSVYSGDVILEDEAYTIIKYIECIQMV